MAELRRLKWFGETDSLTNQSIMFLLPDFLPLSTIPPPWQKINLMVICCFGICALGNQINTTEGSILGVNRKTWSSLRKNRVHFNNRKVEEWSWTLSDLANVPLQSVQLFCRVRVIVINSTLINEWTEPQWLQLKGDWLYFIGGKLLNREEQCFDGLVTLSRI